MASYNQTLAIRYNRQGEEAGPRIKSVQVKLRL